MSGRSARVVLVLSLVHAARLVSADDIPLRDWPVPMNGGVSALGDIGFPGVFVPVAPCRLVDTRVGYGFFGEYGPPALVAGTPRTFNVVASVCTGLPAHVSAFSLNFTVANPAGPGNLWAWPAGFTMPTVATLSYLAGQTVSNAAVVPAGTGTSISVRAGVSGTDVIIDINGYCTNDPNPGNMFYVSGAFAGDAAIGGYNDSDVTGSHGVVGFAGGSGVVHGVEGEIGTPAAAGSAGIRGIAGASTAVTYGVYGETGSNAVDAAAVLGLVKSGTPPLSDDLTSVAGIRGEGAMRGVVGIAGPSGVGVRGFSLDAAGATQQAGSIGYGSTYGVYAQGNLGASGTKSFVEPHPTDPAKVIRFVSLEGPEAGTYFRGTGFTRGGVCVIEVPEAFRIVTAEDGLTVQVTPVETPARTWIESQSLERIVVRSSLDTRFHYLVQGTRRAYRDFEPIVAGDEFTPESPDDRLPRWLPEEGRRRLVSNGTFHPDGSVNLETAERLGWTTIWREAREGSR